MADLTNKYIYESYKSIVGIGTSGTSGLSAELQPLTDGEGHEMPIKVSETEVEISTPATVKSLNIAGFGEVINEDGYFVGPGGGGGGTGTSGTSGTSGLTGSSGTSGVNGTSGTSGTSGRNGFAGLNGSNGSSGTDGSSGTSGIDGSAGLTGTSGTSGIDGTQNLIIDNPNTSIGTILPGGAYSGVINLMPNGATIFQPDGVQNSFAMGYYGACFNNAIYIGHYGQALDNAIVVGHASYGLSSGASVIGNNSTVGYVSENSILFGNNSSLNPAVDTNSDYSVIIGSDIATAGRRSIVIGGGASSPINNNADYNTIIGLGQITGSLSTLVGGGDGTDVYNVSFGVGNTAVGLNNKILGDGGIPGNIVNDSVAIGNNNRIKANGAAAIGNNLLAETEDTVTIHKLQMVDYATLDYIDDVAAAAAGIPLGGVYHTAGILKIRIS